MDARQVPIEIDVTNDIAFRTAVVTHLQFITDKCSEIPELKAKVERHDDIVKVGRWASVPVLAVVHLGLKHFFTHIGW